MLFRRKPRFRVMQIGASEFRAERLKLHMCLGGADTWYYDAISDKTHATAGAAVDEITELKADEAQREEWNKTALAFD